MSARWGRGTELTSSKIHSTLFAHRFVTIQYGFVALAGQTVIVIERKINQKFYSQKKLLSSFNFDAIRPDDVNQIENILTVRKCLRGGGGEEAWRGVQNWKEKANKQKRPFVDRNNQIVKW